MPEVDRIRRQRVVKVAHALLVPDTARLISCFASGIHIVLLLISPRGKRLCHVGRFGGDSSETAIFNAGAVRIAMPKLAFATMRVATLLAASGPRSLNLLGMTTVRV